MLKVLFMLLPLFFLIGCAEENPTKVNVKMINQEGDSIGTVQLQEQASGGNWRWNCLWEDKKG